jgi:Na+-transporting methylmalonyl-CoA/oxaloacetate decarboxylase gamma subunit
VKHRASEWRLTTACGVFAAVGASALMLFTVLGILAALGVNEAMLLLGVLLLLTGVGAVLVALAVGVWQMFRLLRWASRSRRDARERRHADPAVKLTLPDAETQVIARYENELSDLTQFYVFPGDLR